MASFQELLHQKQRIKGEAEGAFVCFFFGGGWLGVAEVAVAESKMGGKKATACVSTCRGLF